jgi:hypothetical protein
MCLDRLERRRRPRLNQRIKARINCSSGRREAKFTILSVLQAFIRIVTEVIAHAKLRASLELLIVVQQPKMGAAGCGGASLPGEVASFFFLIEGA